MTLLICQPTFVPIHTASYMTNVYFTIDIFENSCERFANMTKLYSKIKKNVYSSLYFSHFEQITNNKNDREL